MKHNNKVLPCPKCGAPSGGELCPGCRKDLNPIVSRIKEPLVTVCTRSGKVKIKSGWERISFKEGVKKAIINSLKSEGKIDGVEVVLPDMDDFLRKPGISRTFEVSVVVKGNSEPGGESYYEEYIIPVRLKTTLSPGYSKMGTDYFTGILQLRNETEDRVKYLELLEKKHEGFAFNKKVKQPNGTDYYGTSNHILQVIARELQNKFGGMLKINRKLHTFDRQRSKNVYRLNVLLIMPPFGKHDIVSDGNDLFEVLKLGKKIKLKSLSSSKKKDVYYSANSFSKLEPEEAVISQKKPLAVIDPESFQQVAVANPIIPKGDKAFVVRFKNRLWVVRA